LIFCQITKRNTRFRNNPGWHKLLASVDANQFKNLKTPEPWPRTRKTRTRTKIVTKTRIVNRTKIAIRIRIARTLTTTGTKIRRTSATKRKTRIKTSADKLNPIVKKAHILYEPFLFQSFTKCNVMNRIIRRFFDASDSNARAGQTDNPPREMEQEAVSRNAGRPGSMADAAGTSGDMDGGGGIGHGMEKDPHLDKGDNGPSPDKTDLGE
jgi:hypothetical protein